MSLKFLLVSSISLAGVGFLVGRFIRFLSCYYPLSIRFQTFSDFVDFYPASLTKEQFNAINDNLVVPDSNKNGKSIELFTALMSVAVVVLIGFAFDLPFYNGVDLLVTIAALLAFTYLVIALSVIDLKSMLLPDNLNYSLLWLGILFALFGYSRISIDESVIGAVSGYVSLYLFNVSLTMFGSKEVIGGGDLKLTAAIGAWVGYLMVPLVLVIACFVGIWFAVAMRLTKKAFPFGQNIAIAGWLINLSNYYISL
ncbi:prepilin peptidase [Vibrio vulnificus]